MSTNPPPGRASVQKTNARITKQLPILITRQFRFNTVLHILMQALRNGPVGSGRVVTTETNAANKEESEESGLRGADEIGVVADGAQGQRSRPLDCGRRSKIRANDG